MSATNPKASETSSGQYPSAWDWSLLDEKLRPRLVWIAVRRYGFSADDAEDLVQDVFGQVWASRPRVRFPETYIHACFQHRCVSAIKRRKSRVEGNTVELDESLPDRCGAETILNACAVHGAFLRLSSDCRLLVASYVLEGNSLEETARKVDSNANAVWKRINRCLRRLIQWLT